MYIVNQFVGSELLVRAPGRINLIGEHTDYNHGHCLPAAISQSIYFGIRKSDQIRIHSLDRNEITRELNLKFSWEIYFKGVLDLLKNEEIDIPAFEIKFGGDLPSGAGLSSSSAIVCGFIYSLNEYFSLGIPLKKLTEYSVRAEKANGLLGGMMDQITILNARKDHALMIDCNTWTFQPISVIIEDICWLVVDTKVKHNLIDTDYNSRSKSCVKIKNKLIDVNLVQSHISELTSEGLEICRKYLSEEEYRYLSYVIEENERVKQFVIALNDKSITDLGQILIEGHKGLSEKYKVSSIELDFLVNYATLDRNCYGARMMGGGFGGSTIHLIPLEHKEEYIYKISLAYSSRFGYSPDIFVAEIENGVSVFNL